MDPQGADNSLKLHLIPTTRWLDCTKLMHTENT